MAAPLAEKVLGLLFERGGAPVSGEEMARSARVTRAAVWKAVEGLRAEGYEIESVPARGYRLGGGPGALRAAEIEARTSGLSLKPVATVLSSVDSTNREAARMADRGAREGTVVAALEQTAGRGRLGRNWFGKPGSALMASVVLKPALGPEKVALLTYVAAVALADALLKWLPAEAVEIKWPNDVLINGRKVAGILLESRIEGASVDYVVLGLGVNVLGTREDLPAEFREASAVVEEEAGGAVAPSPLAVLASFLQELDGAYAAFLADGFTGVKDRFDRHFRMAGREVTVRSGANLTTGVAKGVDGDGSLLIMSEDRILPIRVGDVLTGTTKGT